ncbi:hypothetical protein C8Q80DRAFT_478494 [Daedaleopsis nitida]|nr:hypothetical protein C8Q80DRAFT_478494 [Daedaleopsis nitida]
MCVSRTTYWNHRNFDHPVRYASLGASIAANSIVILLTWWKTFSAVLMLFNLVMQVLSSSINDTNAVFVIWPYFCEIFTAMILSRFILDLRLLLFEESDDLEPTTSELIFLVPIKTAKVIGNLGATVRSHSAGRHGMRKGWEEDDEVPEFSRDPFQSGLKASLAVSEVHRQDIVMRLNLNAGLV